MVAIQHYDHSSAVMVGRYPQLEGGWLRWCLVLALATVATSLHPGF